MEGSNFYKIGYTEQSLDKRLNAIQIGCPKKIIVIFTIDGPEGNIDTERILHAHLAPYATNGGTEWFELPKDYPLESLKILVPRYSRTNGKTKSIKEIFDLDTKRHQQLKNIAKANSCTVTQILRNKIDKCIAEYEAQHGSITVS